MGAAHARLGSLQLIKDGKVHRARIGIKLGILTPALAKDLGLDAGTKGILVEDVVKGSPADKAGLKQGDVIVGFGGEKIPSVPAFRLKVAASPIGKSFDIEYYREGGHKTTTITPAPAENVVFDIEREQGQERGRGGHVEAEHRRVRHEAGEQRADQCGQVPQQVDRHAGDPEAEPGGRHGRRQLGVRGQGQRDGGLRRVRQRRESLPGGLVGPAVHLARLVALRLAEELAPYRFEEMVPLAPITTDVWQVDWKIAMDNYLESYHVPIGHPGLYRMFTPDYEDQISVPGVARGSSPSRE